MLSSRSNPSKGGSTMAAAASSFGTTCRLRRAAQAFAISHSHILRSNANLSLQRNFCSHLTVSTSSGLHLLHLMCFFLYVFWCYLVKFGDLLSPFALLTFGRFAFCFFFKSLLPNLELSKPHTCVVCVALPASLAVVPTQGFCFF